VNSDLRLDFSQTTPEEFERRRLEYHRGIQEEFFEEWEISGTETHRMRRGDSLWVLSHRRFNVPLWLLRQYNPDIDFEAPAAGSQITVPLLRRRELDAGAQAIAGGELAAG
jgi:membrane-bound lytic murein transglycosylase D